MFLATNSLKRCGAWVGSSATGQHEAEIDIWWDTGVAISGVGNVVFEARAKSCWRSL